MTARTETRALGSAEAVDPRQVLNALPQPVIVLDRDGIIRFVNFDAQLFFGAGESMLLGFPLSDWLPEDSPVFSLIHQVFSAGSSVSEYGLTLETPRIGIHLVAANAAPMGDPVGHVVLTLQEVSIARRFDNQLTHRNAARSVTAMSAMLAHEVKNPLSGIRGAAQLIEQAVGDRDRELTRLICEEADRIVALVNRMEVFADSRPIERAPVNIHLVLERVRRLAENGFARHVRFVERYDPSLPPVYGNRDQLVQVFLNLVKNAAESVSSSGGEVILATGYQRGVSIALPGTNQRTNLPLAITVQDNGPGIPEDLQAHLFDPFVTTKKNGTGLGLALVAKVIGDHGGIIECQSRPRRTVFKTWLPMHPEIDAAALETAETV
ncbi:MAG: PAS domain-containing protein [Inquilinus sp.]|nr:PAS domain-containing protein [Inquilinus sp.]